MINEVFAADIGGTPSGGMAAFAQFLPLILIGLLFYFVLIRPRKKKAKKINQKTDVQLSNDVSVISSQVEIQPRSKSLKANKKVINDNVCKICNNKFNLGETIKQCEKCSNYFHITCWGRNEGCNQQGCPSNSQNCPSCGEQIKKAALKCRHCGEYIDEKLKAEFKNDIEIASSGKRLANLVIDTFTVIFFTSIIVGITQARTGIPGNDAGLWFYLLLYYFLFEIFCQRTLAKFITGTKVVMEDGSRPPAFKIFIRTISRFVPFEAFSGRDGTWWHDRWSKTLVVKK